MDILMQAFYKKIVIHSIIERREINENDKNK
jgi:hypothetical protein